MAKKRTVKPTTEPTAMRREQGRSYFKSGNGIVVIGRFRSKATWEVTCDNGMHDVQVLQGESSEGAMVNAVLRITFGYATATKREALASILRQRAADKCSRFTVLLNGVKHDSLYLHELAVIQDDPIPCGLVFSNIAP
jgi:hypothetical protein